MLTRRTNDTGLGILGVLEFFGQAAREFCLHTADSLRQVIGRRFTGKVSAKIDVEDAVVFAAGANRGIGRAIAEEALARGSKKSYAAARTFDQMAAGVNDSFRREGTD